MDGPPMSMFSMQVVEVSAALDRLLEGVEVHDHHVDHLDAMLGRLGHVLRDCRASRAGRRARFGWSVFTRPSIISGNCVTSSMGVTGTPASAMRAAPCRPWR